MTPHRVNRADLLQALESVAVGLSPKDVLAQSASFVFSKGWVATFDNEVHARCRCPMPAELTAAVQGPPLLEALRNLPDDEVEVSVEGRELAVAGTKDTVWVSLSLEILLPVGKVEPPGDWYTVGADFADALKLAAEVTGKDDNTFLITCVNVHPTFVEATDNFHVVRYAVETGVEAPVLIRAVAAKAVASVHPSEVSETDNWLHFRSAGPSGLRVSCRKYGDPYFDLTELTKATGVPIQLPKALAGGIKLAEGFAKEYSDDVRVGVELRRNSLTLTAAGVSGRTRRHEKVSYAGPEVEFTVGPVTLAKLVEQHPEVEIATTTFQGVEKTNLVVRAGSLFYLATTRKPGANGRAKKEGE